MARRRIASQADRDLRQARPVWHVLELMHPLTAFAVSIALLAWSGLPVAFWLFVAGERRKDVLLLHALVSGVLLVGVGLQVLWRLGCPVSSGVLVLLVAVSVVNVVFARRIRSPRAEWASWAAVKGIGAVAAVAIVLGSVYLTTEGEPYYGRAWGDELNYSLTTHFLLAGSTRSAASPVTAVVVDGGLLDDRIGQNFLQAWMSTTSGLSALESFYPTVMIGVLVLAAAAYLAGVRLRLSETAAAFVAVVVALSPPVTSTHLESFLSQIVATPVILYALVAVDESVSAEQPVQLLLVALSAAWVYTAYFEELPLLLLSSVVILGVRMAAARQATRAAIALAGAMAIGVLGGIAINPRLLKLVGRIGGLPEFGTFFPWAYKPEGAARLVLGDGVTLLGTGWVWLVAILVAFVTVCAVVALLVRGYQRREPLGLGIATMILVPYLVAVLPGDHVYPFYKLLQSFWPWALLGAGAIVTGPRTTSSRALRGILVGGAITIGFVMVGSSVRMLAIEATGESPRSGMNDYLRAYGEAAVRSLTAGRLESRLLIAMPVRMHWDDLLANGIAALQLDDPHRQMQVQWAQIGDRALKEDTDERPRLDPSLPTLRPLKTNWAEDLGELLVLQIGAPFVRPSDQLLHQVDALGRMRLYEVRESTWLFLNTVVPPFQNAFMSHDEGLDVGNRPDEYVRLDFESTVDRPSGVPVTIRHDLAARSPVTCWHVFSNNQFGTCVATAVGSVTISTGPLRRGTTQVYVGPRASPFRADPTHLRTHISEIVYGPR